MVYNKVKPRTRAMGQQKNGGKGMKKLAKWIALLMTVCVLLSCTAALAEEGEKKEIDTMRIGVAAMPPTMDPTLNVGNATIRVHYNMFETLIQADENNNYAHKPMLATEWGLT